jgi:hypothetical protein
MANGKHLDLLTGLLKHHDERVREAVIGFVIPRTLAVFQVSLSLAHTFALFEL